MQLVISLSIPSDTSLPYLPKYEKSHGIRALNPCCPEAYIPYLKGPRSGIRSRDIDLFTKLDANFHALHCCNSIASLY